MSKSRKQPTTLEAVLRRAIEKRIEQGDTINGLARECEIPQPSLQMFMAGTRPGIALKTLNRLVVELGLELRERKRA